MSATLCYRVDDGLRPLQRLRMSFFAYVVGCALGDLLVGTALALTDFGWLGPGVFLFAVVCAFPGWLLAMAPLSRFVQGDSVVCRWFVAPVFGAAVGLAILAGEVAAGVMSFEVPWVAYAVTIAATSWSVFAILLRSAQRRAARIATWKQAVRTLRGIAHMDAYEHCVTANSIDRGVGMTRWVRARWSLIALFVGWAVGCTASLAFMGASDVTWSGARVWAAATLAFAFVPWLIVMLPLALAVSPGHAICRSCLAPAFGFVMGAAALAIELELGGVGFVTDLNLSACAGLTGATSWSLFAWILRRAQRGNDERSKRSRSEVM